MREIRGEKQAERGFSPKTIPEKRSAYEAPQEKGKGQGRPKALVPDISSPGRSNES